MRCQQWRQDRDGGADARQWREPEIVGGSLRWSGVYRRLILRGRPGLLIIGTRGAKRVTIQDKGGERRSQRRDQGHCAGSSKHQIQRVADRRNGLLLRIG